MPEFRKKPVVIDAIRNDGTWPPILAWLEELAGSYFVVPIGSIPPITRSDDGSLEIRTLEGKMRAEVGDWVICGVAREFYPCKPEIFAATYEPVEEAPDAPTA